MDEAVVGFEIQLRDDVALHDGRRGRGQRDHRGGTERGEPLAQHTVVGAKVVPPLRNAVGLVDGDQCGLGAGEELGEARHAQSLGRDKEEVEPAREVFQARGT